MTYILDEYDQGLVNILKNGCKLEDRTGVGILALFGLTTRYNISERIPLLTKRKITWKAIAKELLWMMSGSTNINDLEAMGSHIWSPWKDSEFTKKHNYDDGEIGPGYGFQLRHFGGDFNNKVNPGGTDQLLAVLNLLKTDKRSRRILFTYWNANIIDKVKLPPCHHTAQFFVDDKDQLSCLLYQRSADYPVGVGCGNLLFYSFLTYILAQQANLIPKELIHVAGNAHIYLNQIPAVEEYLARVEKPASPKLNLTKAVDIDSYKIENFNVTDYNPLPKIEMPIAI